MIQQLILSPHMHISYSTFVSKAEQWRWVRLLQAGRGHTVANEGLYKPPAVHDVCHGDEHEEVPQEEEISLSVTETNAAVHPNAVLVPHEHTALADVAVVGSRRLVHLSLCVRLKKG